MRVVIAPCAYKGTFSPTVVARAMAEGVRHAIPDAIIDMVPLADGGDGTIEALYAGTGGKIKEMDVEGALGEPETAKWLKLPDIAIVELASACGIAKLSGRTLKPLDAHTYGLGQVIKTVVESRKFKRLIIAVGGSASTDGGAGALTACGIRFFNEYGDPVVLGGGFLHKIAKVDMTSMKDWTRGLTIQVATDVHNPLLGPNGAAQIFGPQKGALEADVALLESNLLHFANVLSEATGRKGAEEPGAGAAGGTGFGLSCGLGATIISGFGFVREVLNLDSKLEKADLIITGEGKLDSQTVSGKALGELLRINETFKKPMLAVPACVVDADLSKLTGFKMIVPAARRDELAQFDDIARATAEAIKQSR